MKKWNIILCCLLLFLFSETVAADGGGGMIMGYQISQYPFFEDNYILNNNMGLIYYGGFGYGVSNRDIISGGFGYALMDHTNGTGIAGGFGGVIKGIRILKRPINLSLISYTGFGGIYTGSHIAEDGHAFFCISEELNLELGFPLFRWFMPVIYVGYQAAGNIIPGKPFQSFLSYTPVAGIKISWGDFY